MKVLTPVLAGSNRALLLTGGALLALALPTVAQAQEEEAKPAAAAAESEATGNEIVVTATKREQTLQDVPVAVTVTTAETLERAQIRDIKDLASVVPSLRISQLQSSANTNFFIRGFGNGANNAGIEPSVGVFIDGVYRSRSAAQIGDFPDVKRIEVLRGPQSTLFGKNASAGVISIVTQEPKFEFGGNVEATYGNFNAVTVKGVVTGPLSEQLAVSLAGGYNRRDGNVTNPVTGNDINERNRWFVRGQMLFEPSSDLKVRLIGDYSKIDELCCAVVTVQAGTGTALIQALGGHVNSNADQFSGVSYTNFDSTNKIENWGVSGQIDYGVGPLKVTSITAYRRTNALTNQDSDFSDVDIIGRNYQDLRIDTFTQELRVATDWDGPVNAMIGGYYFNEKVDQTNQLFLGSQFRPYADLQIRNGSGGAFTLAAVEQLIGAAQTGNPATYVGKFFANGTGFNEAYKLKDESISIFGQLDFEVADRLTLTAGGNYTKNTKDYSTNNVSNEVFASIQLNNPTLLTNATNVLIAQGVATAINGSVPGAIPSGVASAAQIGSFASGTPPFGSAASVVAFNTIIVPRATAGANALPTLSSLQLLPPFLNVPNALESGKLSDDDFSYTLRLAYDLTDRINVYASYATGYKAASINLSRDSRPTAADLGTINTNAAYTSLRLANLTSGSRFALPEKSKVWEAGLKANWGLASANVAVFKQSIENFQSNVFTGTGFLLANAGKQSTWGIEFEGLVKPTPELSLSVSWTYLNPVYDSFVRSVVGDISGTKPTGVPPISATFGANWNKELGNGDRIILRGDFHYESQFTTVEGLPNLLVSNGAGGFTAASIDAAKAASQLNKHEVNDLNASLTYAMANGLELSVWGRNLLNERYIIQIFPSPAQFTAISGYPNQPRTYGVSARFRF